MPCHTTTTILRYCLISQLSGGDHSSQQFHSTEGDDMTLVSKPFSIQVSQYQNVSILDFIGVKNNGAGGDNWSYKTCKAPIKSSSPTKQQPVFLQAGYPSCCPTKSVKTLKGNFKTLKAQARNQRRVQEGPGTPTVQMSIIFIGICCEHAN